LRAFRIFSGYRVAFSGGLNRSSLDLNVFRLLVSKAPIGCRGQAAHVKFRLFSSSQSRASKLDLMLELVVARVWAKWRRRALDLHWQEF
jgi:hypothetical protein